MKRSLVALALLGCGARRAPDGSDVASISFRFGWRPGLELAMEIDDRVERALGDGVVQAREVRARVPLTVRAVAGGLDIVTGPAEILAVRIDGREVDVDVGAAITLLEASLPSLRVTPEGALVDLLDPESEVRALHGALAQAFAGLEVPPAVAASLDALAAEPIRRRAGQDWYALVEAWSGRWVLGEVRRDVVVERVPGDPDMTWAITRRWLGRAPCHESDPEPACAVLELRREATDEAVQAWLAPQRRRIEAAGGAIAGVELSDAWLLVVEPDTLVPRRADRTSVRRVEIRAADGATSAPVSRVETRALRFSRRSP